MGLFCGGKSDSSLHRSKRCGSLAVSIAIMTTQTETYACRECNGPRSPDASVKGSFCSETCWLRRKGRKALNQVRADHRLCVSCGRQLKQVDKPPAKFIEDIKHTNGTETAKAIVGFQDRTPEADTGVKEYTGEHEASSLYREGTICDCGMTDTRGEDTTLRDTEWKTVLANFIGTFQRLEREGAIPKRLNADLFMGVFKESRERTGTGDLELAVGAGLYR